MDGCLKLVVAIGLAIGLVIFLSSCGEGAVNTVPNPQPTITYETCDTPNCGEDVKIIVE